MDQERGVIDWSHYPGSDICCPLTSWEDYVISHRPDQFTLSYRPKDSHIPLGQFTTLELAKSEAVEHKHFRETWGKGQRESAPHQPEKWYVRITEQAWARKRVIDKSKPSGKVGL